MLRWLIAVALIWASPAWAQSFLVEPSLSACQARSAAQCATLGCDGVTTVYWWSCQVLATPTASGGASGAGGTTGLTIIPGDGWYDVSTANTKFSAGLTPAEQTALQTVADLGDSLPFIVKIAKWASHLTPAQITAINNNPAIKAELTAIQSGGTVDLRSPAVQKFAADALNAGLITQAVYNAILAWQAQIANP